MSPPPLPVFASVSLLIVSIVTLSTSIERTDMENHSVYEQDKMILIQLNEIHLFSKKRKNNKNKNNKTSTVNCYLKWDDYTEQKSYFEKMHNEIIKMPVEESLKSLHKFGHLGYLREEAYDGKSYVIKHLFSEAWSEEENNNNNSGKNNKNEGYCKVSSDIIKARLPKAIEIIMQREKLDDNKNKTTTKKGRQLQQQKQHEKEDYKQIVKSLKDFVQLFEQKEKEGKNPRVYVSY
jgi:hypothetical protein